MTANAHYLCGSGNFLWASQFGQKLVLGMRRKWPRLRHDDDDDDDDDVQWFNVHLKAD